jgi:hypothetical protein
MKNLKFICLALLLVTIFLLLNCGGEANLWEILGSLYFNGSGTLSDIVADKGFVYIAAGGDGIYICDVSDPKNPSSISKLDTDDSATGVFKKDNYLYVADKYSGLLIIDVTKPSSPVKVGSDVKTGMSAEAVVAQNNYAYWVGGSASEGYLFITDVNTPTNPTTVSSLKVCNRILGAIYVDGSYAYIGDYSGVFYIVDISNPASPSLVAILTNTGIKNSQALEITKWNNYVFLSNWYGGLFIIDVTNPSAPVVVVNLGFTDTTYDSSVAEPYIVVAVSYAGLFRFDITDPLNPKQVGTPLIPTGASVAGVYIDGNYAYFINGIQQYLYTARVN